MAGLRGQVREPGADPRARRNSQNLAEQVDFVDPAGVISIDGDGYLALALASDGGLTVASSELTLDLDTDPGLALSASGLTAVVQGVLDIDASGIKLVLAADPGLEDSSGLRVKIKTDGGVVRDADGLSLAAATTLVIGGVNQAAAQADSGETSVTLTSVTDPADSPADADALRDDLVANALAELQTRDGELETSIETLAGEFNDLLAKLRTAGILTT